MKPGRRNRLKKNKLSEVQINTICLFEPFFILKFYFGNAFFKTLTKISDFDKFMSDFDNILSNSLL